LWGSFSFIDKVRREFLDKAFVGMKRMDFQDLPSLVYQLLVLASKGFSKREMIQGIVGFFWLTTRSKVSSIIRQVEGIVLLHLNFCGEAGPVFGAGGNGVLNSVLLII